MVLVKNFYLLHFQHSLLPLYIGAPTDAKRPLHSTLCSGLSRNNNIIFLFQPDLLCVLFQQFPLKEGGLDALAVAVGLVTLSDDGDQVTLLCVIHCVVQGVQTVGDLHELRVRVALVMRSPPLTPT